MRQLRFGIWLAATLLASGAQAQTANLPDLVRGARTRPIAPQMDPPAWMSDAKLQLGFALFEKHGSVISQVLAGSSLASTFAAKDIAPVLMKTGALPKQFVLRMAATGAWMKQIMLPAPDRETFLKKNYERAFALGQLHHDVGMAVGEGLAWDPKTRVPMSQQAVGFVLESFAWWPVEVLLARGEVDPKKDRAELDGWFHLWSIVGYGMGIEDALLPKDFDTAARLVALLRKAQYADKGEAPPEGLPVLLGGHVRMLAGLALAEARKAGDNDVTLPQLVPGAAKGFVEMLKLSPGLMDALGLGPDAVGQLLRYAATPPPK